MIFNSERWQHSYTDILNEYPNNYITSSLWSSDAIMVDSNSRNLDDQNKRKPQTIREVSGKKIKTANISCLLTYMW